MKNMRKLFALALALVMVLSLSVTAFAQTVDAGNGKATITVENPAKGETYAVYKLFDANVTGNEDGSVFYTGTIPATLEAYFETKNTIGEGTDAVEVEDYIVSKAPTLTGEAIAAMKAWTATVTATATAKSDGTELVFTDLPYGYYVVTSTQAADDTGTGAISVTSTNPNGTIVDKNVTKPSLEKTVDDPDVNIGQTVTYTATATTATWLGEAENSEIVTKYVIHDTLPNYLDTVKITKITIGGVEYKVDGEVPQFDTVEGYDNKAVVIPWAEKGTDGKWASLYANGAEIVVTYTAVVTDEAVIDGDGNKNVVTLVAYTTPDESTPPDPWEDTWTDEEIIFTYAAALKKVDENQNPLDGAKFAVNGLTVEGSNGDYTVVTYDPTSTTLGTVMETDDLGILVIKGLASDETLIVTETAAPAGYNKLTEPIEVEPQVTKVEITTSAGKIYYDEEGNVTEEETTTSKDVVKFPEELNPATYTIVNQAGSELPSTGGMGTTMFYAIGALLVLTSAVLLVTKKRMGAAE